MIIKNHYYDNSVIIGYIMCFVGFIQIALYIAMIINSIK